jgi:exopolysaccharide biosynthesis polyprenyl glycosylphosphotransferase
MSEQTATSGFSASPRTLDITTRHAPARRASAGLFAAARLTADLASLGCAAFIVSASSRALSPLLLTLVGAATIVSYAVSGLYSARQRSRPLADIRQVLSLPALITMIAAATALALGHAGVGDAAVRFWLLAGTLTVTARVSLLGVEQVVRRNAQRTQGATLIVGAGRVGHLAAKRLLDDPAFGLRPVGFLDKEPLGNVGDGLEAATALPVLGASWDLEEVVHAHGIDTVLIAFSTAPNHVVLDMVRRCWRLGVAVMVVPRLYEVEGVRAHTEHLGALPLVTLDPSNPGGWMMAAKYAIDRIVAFVALVLVAPIIGAVMLVILISSGRPIFFRQRRVGRDGHVFEMLKFRTMSGRPEATGEFDAEWAALATGQGHEVVGQNGSSAGPDRRTPIGSFLRRTSLDELPQLWNVLSGDMSLIGPRPERLHYVELFEQSIYRYPDRHRVKSGLTGWAQVNGLRGNTSLADRVEWDNFYIENWSPWLDLKILVKTIPALLAGRGAR